MKNYWFTIACFFLSSPSIAQTKDDFSDGNFSTAPAWSGSTNQFIINAAQQLQLNATGAGTSYLTTDLPVVSSGDFEWQLHVKQSFAPSGSNFGRVYLASDKQDLTQPLNGYFIQFGEAGSNDAVELFRQSGSAVTSICRASDGSIATSFSVGIRILREEAGLWKLFVDYTGGTNFAAEGAGVDVTYTSFPFMGILCVYTSSNSTKFYYDDFRAGPVLTAPTLPTPQPVLAAPKDILFTEIFPDVSPSVGLPEAEYVEIRNRSLNPVDLSGWKLSDGTSVAVLPSQIILPEQFWIITSTTSETDFIPFGNVIAVSGFPTLNNTEDKLTLKTSDGMTIDSVHYSTENYNDADKAEGGWSLELIDLNNLCGEEQNWTASQDPAGGTPGKPNSVFADKPDLTPPRFLRVVAASTDTLLLTFDEKLDKAATTDGTFALQPALPIRQINFADYSLRQIQLVLAAPLQVRQLYAIDVRNVRDCAGNSMLEESGLDFSLPEQADSLDLVINEVLFNPRPLGVDFVEVYNRSPKYVNLKRWKLAHVENNTVSDEQEISSEDLILSPDSYLVFTSDPLALKNNYPQGLENNFIKIPLPGMPDDEGTIALVDSQGLVIDDFFYSKNFHSVMIKDEEGVSLERISFSAGTNDHQNWKSASAQAGFATPGYRNSNALSSTAPGTENITIDPEVFTPNTGAGDYAKINYSFGQPGYIANIKIVDPEGRSVKTIANNETLGVQGFFRWDGDRDDGSMARMGYYVVWVEVFDMTGFVKTFRKRAVLYQ